MEQYKTQKQRNAHHSPDNMYRTFTLTDRVKEHDKKHGISIPLYKLNTETKKYELVRDEK